MNEIPEKRSNSCSEHDRKVRRCSYMGQDAGQEPDG